MTSAVWWRVGLAVGIAFGTALLLLLLAWWQTPACPAPDGWERPPLLYAAPGRR
ncbi:hypothetical protein [Planomonospora algeriensis]